MGALREDLKNDDILPNLS